jgi:DNA polymerase III alpha subunit
MRAMATASRTAAKAPRLSATIKSHNAQNTPKTPSRAQVSLDLARQLMGATRHLSQHPGGFVLTTGSTTSCRSNPPP